MLRPAFGRKSPGAISKMGPGYGGQTACVISKMMEAFGGQTACVYSKMELDFGGEMPGEFSWPKTAGVPQVTLGLTIGVNVSRLDAAAI